MNPRILYSLIWLSIQCIAALFTELYADEAYYWMYSKYLAWGYFDHPPMIALLIKTTSFIPGEFGVRILSILLITLSFYVFSLKLEKEKIPLFFGLVLSSLGLQIIGFLALPDAPLLFFTALFYYTFDNYYQQNNFKNTLLFGLVCLALIYSKYHGVLIIGFAVLANLNVLKRRSLWAAALLVIIGYIPHLWWQYDNNFPSYYYHAIERNAGAYNFNFTLDYIGGQLVFWGIFTGVFCYFALFKYKTTTAFERTMKYSVIGFILFFAISSYKGYVEVNWTLPVIFGLFYFGTLYAFQSSKFKYYIKIAIALNLIIVIGFKIYLIIPLENIPNNRSKDFRGHKTFVENIHRCENKYSMILTDNYQDASILNFYSGKLCSSINVDTRRNQYDIWKFHENKNPDSLYFISDKIKDACVFDYPGKGEHRIVQVKNRLPILSSVKIKINRFEKNGRKIKFQTEFINFDRLMLTTTHLPTYIRLKEINAQKEEKILFEKQLNDIDLSVPFSGKCKSENSERCTYILYLETNDMGTWRGMNKIIQ